MQKQSILLIAPSHGTVKIMQKNAKNIPKRASLGCSCAKKMQKMQKMQKKNKTQSHEHYRNAVFSKTKGQNKK